MAKAGHWNNSEKAVRQLMICKSGYLLRDGLSACSASTEARLLLTQENGCGSALCCRSFLFSRCCIGPPSDSRLPSGATSSA